jgi:ABC-type transporter Mla maintaining outer membrane lipid asymmetry ATPase subunit MlaF
MNENQPPPVMELREVSVGSIRDLEATVIEGMNWSVAAGEFWVLAGREYSGKSDLLMLLAGLMPPVTGHYTLFGRDVRGFGEAALAERLRVGLVFQGGQLFNHLTVAENIALPLLYHQNLPPAETARRVQTLLDLMELTSLAGLTPANIAANMRQRVGLARALVLQPEILLLDNPLAVLGARHSQWWLHFLEQLAGGHEYFGRRPMTLVVATDDLRPWQSDRHKFALLHEKKFSPLPAGLERGMTNDPIIKELLALPEETAAG